MDAGFSASSTSTAQLWAALCPACKNSSRGSALDKAGALQQKRSEILALAQRYGLGRIRVFGSSVRGEAHAGGDLDFLVQPGPDTSIFDLGPVQVELYELLGFEVDVVTEKGLKPRIRQLVLDQAVPL